MATSRLRVFHGRQDWFPGISIVAPSITYMQGRGQTIEDSRLYAQGLFLKLTDFTNRSVLNIAMHDAQSSGFWSPFVSVTTKYEVARSFATNSTGVGYVLTLEGPEDEFYDFQKIRQLHGVPPRPEFEWLSELGIPMELGPPFELIRVEQVSQNSSRKHCIFKKK